LSVSYWSFFILFIPITLLPRKSFVYPTDLCHQLSQTFERYKCGDSFRVTTDQSGVLLGKAFAL